jgi:hypothetical protein
VVVIEGKKEKAQSTQGKTKKCNKDSSTLVVFLLTHPLYSATPAIFFFLSVGDFFWRRQVGVQSVFACCTKWRIGFRVFFFFSSSFHQGALSLLWIREKRPSEKKHCFLFFSRSRARNSARLEMRVFLVRNVGCTSGMNMQNKQTSTQIIITFSIKAEKKKKIRQHHAFFCPPHIHTDIQAHSLPCTLRQPIHHLPSLSTTEQADCP